MLITTMTFHQQTSREVTEEHCYGLYWLRDDDNNKLHIMKLLNFNYQNRSISTVLSANTWSQHNQKLANWLTVAWFKWLHKPQTEPAADRHLFQCFSHIKMSRTNHRHVIDLLNVIADTDAFNPTSKAAVTNYLQRKQWWMLSAKYVISGNVQSTEEC